MRCSTCQAEIPADSVFCAECGAKLLAVCRACGADSPPAARFCRRCGERLAESPPERPSPAPVAYTPKHLAEKILTSRAALEGERKQVTVFFADVKGSMELAEQLDPEEWHRLMDRFFAILADGVHRFEGTVNQFTGDGIMALFGAPIAHEDHAQRACHAALHLRDALQRYGDELRLQGLSFSVRMGLNSGEVVVGRIGDDLRMDYTAQGHTVGLAARMQQIAAPDRVYLTERTARLVEGYFALRDLGESSIKGVQEPLRIFELTGVGRLRTRFDASRARGLSRFVGRDEQMAVLERALAEADQGNARVVAVVGEAGVGKSRLCYEFTERVRARGIPLFQARAVAHGKAIPFLPVLELFRSYFGITEQDDDRDARRKIAGTLVLLDRDLEAAFPLLFDFLGVADPERPAPPMDPESRQLQLLDVIGRAIRARSQRQPGVTLIEDLHWLDAGSEAFLARLVGALPGTRTLWVVNSRPEYRAAWMQDEHSPHIALVPLGSEAIRELLGALLGTDRSLGHLGDLIHERTAGNPFFIEEVVQSLAEAGALEGTRGAYRLVRPVEQIAIPGSVQGVLAARIDRLPEREKAVLQTAAVIGRQFPEPVLAAVCERSREDLEEALRVLAASEFLYEEELYPEVELAFKHPLTQEVAYRSQLSDRRARIHTAVARTIEARYADKLDERAALLAHHWEGAGDVLQAARWHRRAAEWSGWQDPAEALRHWRRVREVLRRVPESAETMDLGLLARVRIVHLGSRFGIPVEETRELLDEGRRLADSTGNLTLHGLLLAACASAYSFAGELDEGLRCSVEAVAISDRTPDRGLRAITRILGSNVNHGLGRLTEALALVDEAIELTGGDPDVGWRVYGGRSPYVTAVTIRAGTLVLMGRLGEAARDAEQGLDLARTRGEREPSGTAFNALCHAAYCRGEGEQATAHARHAFELTEQSANVQARVLALDALGMAHIASGSPEPAVTSLEAALATMRERRATLNSEGRRLALLAEAHRARGELARARALAEESIAVSRRRKTRVFEAEAHLALARVLLGAEGAQGAGTIRDALGHAEALVEETGARVLQPFIHVERAELAALTGDAALRQRELGAAHRLFLEIGAPLRAERVAKELGE